MPTSADYPAIADVTGDFVYARLENGGRGRAGGYASGRARSLGGGGAGLGGGRAPDGLPYVADPARVNPRDTFVFFINGAKVRAPPARRR